MRMVEIRERRDEELETLSRQLAGDIFKLRVQKATNQLENTNAIQKSRRDRAKVLTVLRSRQLGLESSNKETSK